MTNPDPRDALIALEWRPIETAPLDGTDLLVFRHDYGVMLARFIAPSDFLTEHELDREHLDDDDEDEADWFCADYIAGCRLDADLAPTHWMPLPDPPRSIPGAT